MEEITYEELDSLTNVIKLKFGLDFTSYEKKSLKRRVSHVMKIHKVSNSHELWKMLLSNRNFISEFIDGLTVGLTSLFRDPVLWKALRNEFKSGMLADRNLNIWHAGCSTGEEVFTLGIVLQEQNLQSKIRAIATDLNRDSVLATRSGLYRKEYFDDYNKNYVEYNPFSSLKKYVDFSESSFKMDPTLISHVKVEQHNLVHDQFYKDQDIIFCRNVMIYFDDKLKVKILNQFYDCLRPNGLFIIGFFDSLLPLIDSEKFMLYNKEAKIFKKVG